MTTSTPNCETMTIDEILKELERYTGQFPRRAMQQAVEQRDAVTPELLRVLEEVASDPVSFAKRSDYMLGLFAMFLLAQFREKRACRPVVAIFSTPGEIPRQLAGDTVTEDLKSILASVYDGDPEPLHRLVEDASVDEYVRSTAIDTFIVLWISGQMLREDVIAYYRSLFHGKLERSHSHAWNGLVCAVADLKAPELVEEIRRAYADNLVDPFLVDLEGIERNLVGPPRPPSRSHLITDAISEMEWWSCFRPEESKTARAPAQLPRFGSPLPVRARPPNAVPVRNAKISRNAPCPCGSGKKYKKCCGGS